MKLFGKSDRSAKTVSNINTFKPIKLSELQGATTDFDLYIDVAGRAVLYAPCPYTWSDSERQRLLNDGHTVLFYAPEAADIVSDYLKRQAIKIDTQQQNPGSNEVDLLESEFTKQLYTLHGDKSTSGLIKSLSQQCGDTLNSSVEIREAFSKLAKHDSFSFYHSAKAAAFSVGLAQQLGVRNETLLKDIALGGLLHDLGHIYVTSEILEKPSALNEREWDIMRQHPEWSHEIGEALNLSFVTTEILLHHHERCDGKGYPHGIAGRELIDEVRLVSVCDVFVALTAERPYQKPKTDADAIYFMKTYISDYLEKDALMALSSLLEESKQAS